MTSYAAWLQSSSAATVATIAAGPTGSVAPRPRTSRLSRSAQVAAVAAGVVAVVAIGAGVWAAVGTALSPSETGAPVAEAAENAPPVTPRHDEEILAPADPAATPTPAPTPPPGAQTRPREPRPAPAVQLPSPTPTASPTPEPVVTPVPTIEPLPAPGVVVDASAGTAVYPQISGTDAEPGATVEVVDENEVVRATTVADGSGAWEVSDLSGGACATTASSYLPAGDHSLSARQVLGERTSPLSTGIDVSVAAPPVFLSPTEGEVVSRSGFQLSITGEPLASVQRIKLPDPSPCRPTPMVLDASGAYSSQFTLPGSDTVVTIGIRYIDPATGRHGPASFVTFTGQ
ncbi:hypothetical protein IT882_02605 [Microbacterium schleiferi]|uniref:Bacterial Ig domain-containing protein n=1 Tax=Microbacterium schleiferi TaxID=69362 RepID=A0A7S8MXF9_9MICO|nr:hypothetical protein [Microbacterium schleiferi]QPE05029.1 hypothetical protein IT882_02605 [Microbacterium schleiferi]